LTDETVAPEEGATLANFKGTFSFEHKVSDGNYGSNTYAIFVQFDYAPGAELDEFLGAARESANWAKMAVYESAGTEFYRDDSGVIRAVLQEFPGAVVEGAPAPQRLDVPSEPPFTDDQIKALSGDEAKDAKRAVKEWAAAHLAAYPSQWWDNRATKKGQQPDFKHKKLGIGYWAD
jgi:hypothetical protein